MKTLHMNDGDSASQAQVLDQLVHLLLDPSVTEKTSYGLGCTTIDIETAEIIPFPICKRNTTSNTKGSQNIPYSGRL